MCGMPQEVVSQSKRRWLSSKLKEAARDLQASLEDWLTRREPSWLQAKSAESFAAMEYEVHEAFRKGADALCKAILSEIVEDGAFQRKTQKALKADGGWWRSGGRRTVKVRLLGGSICKVNVPYLRPDISGGPGRKRGQGRRGKGGAGLYPALAALGIWFGVTPALAQEVCRQVTASDSVRAGRAALARRGQDLGHKQTLRLLEQVGHRMLEQRAAWAERVHAAPPKSGPLSGQRVVVGIDGGRVRERRSSKGGRRRAATGHRGYETPWREPKLFVIYVIDDDGKQERSVRPVYDGTLGDCNEMFELLLAYLQELGAGEARSLTLVGDGAPWIWERAKPMAERLGLELDRMSQVIDWSHAVSTLHTIADHVNRWGTTSREAWIHAAKELLHDGQIDELLEHIGALAVGRRAPKIRKHCNYFKNNAARMQYQTFIADNIPTGSGAIESAIRCIINLRLKGCGKFWKDRNAEAMILLRSYLKAGRFDELFQWSLAQATPWWSHQTAYAHSPVVARPTPDLSDISEPPAVAG